MIIFGYMVALLVLAIVVYEIKNYYHLRDTLFKVLLPVLGVYVAISSIANPWSGLIYVSIYFGFHLYNFLRKKYDMDPHP